MVRSSSPTILWSTDNPFLSRRTQTRALCKFTLSREGRSLSTRAARGGIPLCWTWISYEPRYEVSKLRCNGANLPSSVRVKSSPTKRVEGTAKVPQKADGIAAAPRKARSGQEKTHALQHPSAYSTTSSARARSEGDTVRWSSFAVLRLITSSNLSAWTNGSSPGLAPLSI
jgi:hypothetical protein